jgi:hypothetical protein
MQGQVRHPGFYIHVFIFDFACTVKVHIENLIEPSATKVIDYEHVGKLTVICGKTVVARCL